MCIHTKNCGFRTHSEKKCIWNFYEILRKSLIFAWNWLKKFCSAHKLGGLLLSPLYHLIICKSAWKHFQIYSFNVSKSENSVCKFRIFIQKQPKSRFSAWNWGGVTFVVDGTLFSTEEIVSMPAPPAACGYARLKPCDYTGRKRPALPEKIA